MYPNIPNLDLLKNIIPSITFPHFPMQINIVLKGTVIDIRIRTRDRDITPYTDPASVMTVVFQKEVPPWFHSPKDKESIVRWVMDEVLGLLKHELQEHLLVDGKRIFDPHKEENRMPAFAPDQALKELFQPMNTVDHNGLPRPIAEDVIGYHSPTAGTKPDNK